MALLRRITKIRLKPRVWHGIEVIAHATVLVQVVINWESECPLCLCSLVAMEQYDTDLRRTFVTNS